MSDLFEKAFTNGFTWKDQENNAYNLQTTEIGKLNIIDGRVIACDPSFYTGDKPFDTVFPKGSFPVELAIAEINGDERVAYARIRFSEKIPMRWVIAVTEDQDASTLTKDQIFGYGVDSGTGCFMDTSAAETFSKYVDDEDPEFQKTIDQMETTYKDTRSWYIWSKGELNVAMFSTGWGDGFYATYIGYDSENNISRLVSDFGLME